MNEEIEKLKDALVDLTPSQSVYDNDYDADTFGAYMDGFKEAVSYILERINEIKLKNDSNLEKLSELGELKQKNINQILIINDLNKRFTLLNEEIKNKSEKNEVYAEIIYELIDFNDERDNLIKKLVSKII